MKPQRKGLLKWILDSIHNFIITPIIIILTKKFLKTSKIHKSCQILNCLGLAHFWFFLLGISFHCRISMPDSIFPHLVFGFVITGASIRNSILSFEIRFSSFNYIMMHQVTSIFCWNWNTFLSTFAKVWQKTFSCR